MTELASQLTAIRKLRPPKTFSSFLFDLKDAQRIDADIIFTIGINGLDELRRVDPHFSASELFYEDFAQQHRYRD